MVQHGFQCCIIAQYFFLVVWVTPTADGREFILATSFMSALVIILWVALVLFAVVIWLRSRDDRYMQEFPEMERELRTTSFIHGARSMSTARSMTTARSVSLASVELESRVDSRYVSRPSTSGTINPSASLSGSSGEGTVAGASAYTPSARPQYSQFAQRNRSAFAPPQRNTQSTSTYRGQHVGHSVC